MSDEATVTVKTQNPEVPRPVEAVPEPEMRLRIAQHIDEQVSTMRQNAIDSALSAVDEAVNEALRPNRQPVAAAIRAAAPSPDAPAPASRIRLTPMEDYRYRTLPKHLQEYRKPATDHWIAEWLRGMAQRDMVRMGRADDKLAEIARADTAEGTTTATSGLSQGTGGALIPLPFSNLITRARDRSAILRPLATVFTSEALTLRVPLAGVATAAMALEGAVAGVGEPVLTSVLFSKKKMQANFQATDEMLQDSALNIVSFFSERAGSAFGALEDVELCTAGSGTAPHFSSCLAGHAAIAEITEAVSATVGLADVQKLYFGVPAQYRRNACFFATSAVWAILSAIRNTSANVPVFQPQTAGALPLDPYTPTSLGTMLGRPCYDVPLTAGALHFGDPSYIGMLDGGGITAKVSDSAAWASDTIAFRFTTRVDGNMLQSASSPTLDPFRKMLGLTTAGT